MKKRIISLLVILLIIVSVIGIISIYLKPANNYQKLSNDDLWKKYNTR